MLAQLLEAILTTLSAFIITAVSIGLVIALLFLALAVASVVSPLVVFYLTWTTAQKDWSALYQRLTG
jgi:hypothetical protein